MYMGSDVYEEVDLVIDPDDDVSEPLGNWVPEDEEVDPS